MPSGRCAAIASHSSCVVSGPWEAALTGPVKSSPAAQNRKSAISSTWMYVAGRFTGGTAIASPARMRSA